MKSLATHEELAGTVMDINPGASGIPEVGVAFAEPNPHFWRVSLPCGLDPHSSAARRYTTETHVPMPSSVKQ